jgi:hypothetical protein
LIIILHSQTESDILLFLTHRPGMWPFMYVFLLLYNLKGASNSCYIHFWTLMMCTHWSLKNKTYKCFKSLREFSSTAVPQNRKYKIFFNANTF